MSKRTKSRAARALAMAAGGGRGLGHEIARRLLREGCHLAICGRDGEVIQRAVAALRRDANGVDAFAMGFSIG
jgi:NAD(P)-dependent dehydrogenase (short-subunit alcohol dehydrogenase family)